MYGGYCTKLGSIQTLIDYVIDNLPLCLGLLRHYLGTNWEHSSSGQASSVSAGEHYGTTPVESKCHFRVIGFRVIGFRVIGFRVL